MRSILALLTAAFMVAPVAAALSLENPTTEPERYIVAFFTHPEQFPGESYQGARVVENIHGLKMLVVEVEDLTLFEARIMLDDNVRYVVDDVSDHTLHFVPNDGLYGHAAHWGSKRIGGEAAWDVTRGSTAVKVAMVDSGLNKGHEEWSGQSRVLQGFDFRNGDNNPDDTSGCSYHGSHTTGTAGATINNAKGIAGMSQHSVLPLKIFAGGFFGCGTTTTAIVDALKFAGDQGAHVSSNSWGGGAADSAINDAIAYAHNKGTIHVAAAGNSGPCSNCVGEPWKSNPSITIVVSSLTDGDTFSSFSSEGPEVDIIAPGEFIASSTSGTADYHAMSGTSMAAPHVAGAIALYLAANPGASFSAAQNALKSTAENLGFSSARQGSGLVRADAMLGGSTPPPDPACSDGLDNDADGLVDYPNDPGCDSASDDDETNAPTPPPTGITLSVSGYKLKGVKHGDLSWSGATSTNVDVYRSGTKVATTANDGFYTDNTGQKGGGSLTWKVCEAGTTTCSNDATTGF